MNKVQSKQNTVPFQTFIKSPFITFKKVDISHLHNATMFLIMFSNNTNENNKARNNTKNVSSFITFDF